MRWFVRPNVGKSQMMGDFVVFQLSQILSLLDKSIGGYRRLQMLRGKEKFTILNFWVFDRLGIDQNDPQCSLTAFINVFICREWSPTIVEIWDSSWIPNKNARDFSDFSSTTPCRWSGMSAISCFDKSVKSVTFGNKQSPRLSGIFPPYEN